MPGTRKLGRKTDIRRSILRGLVTTLIVNGKIETTKHRALEVASIAEKLITLACKEQPNFETKEITVSKAKLDDKGRKVLKSVTSKNGNKYYVVEREGGTKTVTVDSPSRLAARRQMMTFMVEQRDEKGQSKNTVNYLFDAVAPKYMGRTGGYTRIIKLGARRGDGAEIVRLELV